MTEEKSTLLKKSLKKTLTGFNLWTSFFLIIAIMVMSAAGALMIRLSKGPLDLDFAKARIEAALSDTEKGYAVKIGKANLVWPEVAAPLLIDLKGLKILQGESSALAIDDFSFSLSGRGILKGKILPSRIVLNSPSLKIFNEAGQPNLFWQDRSAPVKEVYGPVRPRDIRDNISEMLAKITDNENGIEALSELKKIQIKNASLQNAKQENLATLNLLLEKNDLGLAGDLKIDYPEKQGKLAYFKSEVVYRQAQKDLTFTANLVDLHTSHIAPFVKDLDIITKQDLFLNGNVQAAFGPKLKLQLAIMNLSMPEGKFVVPDIYDAPIPLKDVVFNAQLNRSEEVLEVTNLSANIGDVKIIATTKAKLNKGAIDAPIELRIPSAKMASISTIFPKSHLDSPAGQWLTQKLSKGRVYDVVMNTDFTMKHNLETGVRKTNMTNTKATFKAEGLTIKYHKTLKAVTDAVAEGSYANDTLLITGKSGNIGAMKGKNVKLKITNLSVKGGGLADINLDGSGPLSSALDYVSDEPIGLKKSDLGFDISQAKGDVNFNLQLNFPTVKNLPKEQVKVKLKGTANNLLLPNVVHGLSLTGGPYDLGFNDGAITLKGKGKLSERAIDLEWLQYLDSTGRDYESKITAKITADKDLRDKFGIGLENYMSGSLPVDVTYIDRGVKASIDVKGDLTPATLHIDPFQYKKDAGVAGTLSLKAHLKGDTLQEVDQLKIDTKNFSVTDGRLIFRKLKDGSDDLAQGKIGSATIRKTKAAVDFEITPSNLLKIIVDGSVVDMEPFIKSDKKKTEQNQVAQEESQPMHISVKAKKLLAVNGESLSKVRLYLEIDNAGDPTRIEMDGDVGSGAMFVRFKPNAKGVRNFKMETSDAGETLKAFGLYDKMRGGKMTISGRPQNKRFGDLAGTAFIEDFAIRKAPALAKLMGATSIKGVNNLLENDGLVFRKLKSDFEWKFKEDGNLLVVKEGRTSGNSLGLTFEGFVNMGTKNTDISGTVIPLSGVNKAVGQIPIIGDILTGGSDAVFAATYSMKGLSSDPKVTVNPLSVLAPGFLRKILFEGDVDAKVKREEQKQ